jgi:hypothetical protein
MEGSKVQRFRGSKVQRFKVQRFKGSRFKGSKVQGSKVQRVQRFRVQGSKVEGSRNSKVWTYCEVIKIDGLAMSPKDAFFCHSRGGGNLVFSGTSGLPLPD